MLILTAFLHVFKIIFYCIKDFFYNKSLLEKNSYDAIYTCGPELMMYKTVQMAQKNGIFVQASLERMMKHLGIQPSQTP